eukprot:169686-Amphidinium_carterae.2
MAAINVVITMHAPSLHDIIFFCISTHGKTAIALRATYSSDKLTYGPQSLGIVAMDIAQGEHHINMFKLYTATL